MIAKSERLAILSEVEQCAQYGLPDLDYAQWREYLGLSETELALAVSRPGPHAQVYCLLQIGYFKRKRDLPFTGFYVGADLNLNSGDNSAKDSTLLIGYESSIGLGIEVSVKAFSVDLDNADNIDTNIAYEGLYLNGFFHF
jgi:hypothetical protein